MATSTSGGVSKATANTVAAMQRSAERRKCTSCGRKSALKHYSDAVMYGTHCRFCGDEQMTMRPWE